MSETKQKHIWRKSVVIKNLWKCAICSQERRKAKDGKFYTNPESKTYCLPRRHSLGHLCPYCKEVWECNGASCTAIIEALCNEHDNQYCREQLGGKWVD